jgi:Leucine-rich repeat (LRR) protein
VKSCNGACFSNALQILEMSYNNLTGSLPQAWASLTTLVNVSMFNNSISGSIPTELLQSWSVVQEVRLQRNMLSGSLPSLSDAGKIKNLVLAGNQFEGTVPSQYGDTQSLVVLDLGFNQLTGTLPSELGNLKALTFLDLSRNRFRGSIPSAWADMESLKVLRLYDRADSEERNSIHGRVPFKACGLTELHI